MFRERKKILESWKCYPNYIGEIGDIYIVWVEVPQGAFTLVQFVWGEVRLGQGVDGSGSNGDYSQP